MWLADEAFSSWVLRNIFTILFFYKDAKWAIFTFKKIWLADETPSPFWILRIFIVYFNKEAVSAVLRKTN